jgi:hypothetical protein
MNESFKFTIQSNPIQSNPIQSIDSLSTAQLLLIRTKKQLRYYADVTL